MPVLSDLATTHLERARTAENGRSAELVIHDGALRQTVIALVAGAELGEHNAPHAATLQVLHGRLRVTGGESSELSAGQLHLLTHERHAVEALEDSVFLLTTVTSQDQPGGHERG